MPIVIEISGTVPSMIGAVRLHDSYRVSFCELKELTCQHLKKNCFRQFQS